MKVIKAEEQFKPITLEITLETENEAIDFYGIFNHTNIMNAANFNSRGRDIREAMELRMPNNRYDDFEDRLKREIYDDARQR